MERTNDKMLNYAIMAFFGTLIVIILFQWFKAPDYALSSEEVQLTLQDERSMVLPEELKNMLDEGTLSHYTLIQLGKNPDNGISGFGKTIYIPLGKLLDKENLKLLRNESKLMLISDFESESLMALNLLTSKGFKNVRAVSNNLSFFKSTVQENFKPGFSSSHTEKARWDYGRFFKNESSGGGTKTGTTTPQVPGGPKVVKVAGGC